MKSRYKVAIYSGEIPSTTFIESLISVVSGYAEVLLFGVEKKRTVYGNNTKVIPSPEPGWKRILHGMWVKTKIFFKDRSAFKILRDIIGTRKASFGNQRKLWSKYGPVVLNKPDVFHLQWGKSLNEWMFIQNEFNIPVVLSLRGAHINYSPLTYPELAEQYKTHFPHLKAFHAVSEAIKKEALMYAANQERIHTIYTGIDSNLFTPYIKKDYGFGQSIQLISVGRFHWKKGYHYALDVIHRLKADGIKIQYHLIAGDAPEEILYKIAALDLRDEVSIYPRMKQKEIFKRMSSADALLLPSVEEGIANVVVEAMFLGLPVITSDCGGMKEAIEHETSGLIFEVRNRNQMKAELIRFINSNESERKTWADNAMRRAKDKFELNRLGEQMDNLYLSVL